MRWTFPLRVSPHGDCGIDELREASLASFYARPMRLSRAMERCPTVSDRSTESSVAAQATPDESGSDDVDYFRAMPEQRTLLPWNEAAPNSDYKEWNS